MLDHSALLAQIHRHLDGHLGHMHAHAHRAAGHVALADDQALLDHGNGLLLRLRARLMSTGRTALNVVTTTSGMTATNVHTGVKRASHRARPPA